MFKILAVILSLFVLCGSAFAKGSSTPPEEQFEQTKVCLIELGNGALVNGNLFSKLYRHNDYLVIYFGNNVSYVEFSGSDLDGQIKKYKEGFINTLKSQCGAK